VAMLFCFRRFSPLDMRRRPLTPPLSPFWGERETKRAQSSLTLSLSRTSFIEVQLKIGGKFGLATEKLERFLPPHPGPLPEGEGEILSRFRTAGDERLNPAVDNSSLFRRKGLGRASDS
jgi:hypothetical protein